MTDIVKVDQTQLMEALAAIVGQSVQEVQGTIVGGQADEILEETEEHYAETLREHGLTWSNEHFDETVERLERIRALRAGAPSHRGATQPKRR